MPTASRIANIHKRGKEAPIFGFFARLHFVQSLNCHFNKIGILALFSLERRYLWVGAYECAYVFATH